MHPTPTARRTHVLDVGLGVLLVGAVAISFAPWLRSGSAQRTSHEVVRAAERLEVLGPGTQRVVGVVWALVPAAGAIALLALVREQRVVAGALALVVGVVEVGLALAVKAAPRGADWGSTAALAIGVALLAVATAVVVCTMRSRP